MKKSLAKLLLGDFGRACDADRRRKLLRPRSITRKDVAYRANDTEANPNYGFGRGSPSIPTTSFPAIESLGAIRIRSFEERSCGTTTRVGRIRIAPK